MFTLKSTSKPVHRAVLIGIYWDKKRREESESLLDELSKLVDTLGLIVIEKLLIKVIQPRSRYLLGSGKAAEIAALAKAKKADVIVLII